MISYEKRTPHRICVVTGSRADYGPLRWLMRDLAVDSRFAFSILATGSHGIAAYGDTAALFAADSLVPAAIVPCMPAADDRSAAAIATGRGIAELTAAFGRLHPEIVVLLGDRFEILAAATAAMLMDIPIAHLHGGESTEGAMDDSIRHAITKMAHLHFVAAEPYARRVVQMGEAPARVFVVGAPGVDAIARVPPLTVDEIARRLGRALSHPLFVVTYHPVTARIDGDEPMTVDALFAALDGFSGASFVVTGVNADPGRAVVAAAIARHVAARTPRASLHTALGQDLYLNLMRHADAVVGNSSSGLVEAPALSVPTVNIGDRQKGRLRAASVIDCGESAPEIAAALRRACDPAFRATIAGQPLPYGGGGAAEKIADALAAADLAALRRKPFYDLPTEWVA